MTAADQTVPFQGNDRLLYGIILGMITFWLFAQTTLNISPVMGRDLGLGASTMNIAVAITALFSGIFIVVIGSLAARPLAPVERLLQPIAERLKQHGLLQL